MFKVLVIAYYFPPMGLSGVQRTTKFVKYLKNYGWEPTVITTDSVAYFAHDNSLMEEINRADIRVIRTKASDPNSLLSKFGTIKIPGEFVRKLYSKFTQSIFIPDNKISWSKKAYEKANELLSTEHFDIIFVSIPPFSSFKMAAKLKRKFNIPLFVDYRDLWYDSYIAFYPTPVHKYLHKKMEYNSLKAANRVIVTNRKIKEKIIDIYKFLTFDDVVIIPHGFDEEDFKSASVRPKTKTKMVLTYSGIFYEHNTPKYFLRAFNQLKFERPDIASNIELHFLGYLGKKNEKLIKKLKLEEFIKSHGYLDHNLVIEKLLTSDVLWMMLGNWKHSETILPGKIMEYIGSGKPFIACVPEGAAQIVSASYGAAFITEPDNIDQIKNTILHVYDLYVKKELPVPNEDFIKQHRRDYLTELLSKQFQSFVKEEIV